MIVGIIALVQLQIRDFIKTNYSKSHKQTLPGIPELLEEIAQYAVVTKRSKKATEKEAWAMMKGETYESVQNKQGKKLSRKSRRNCKEETESKTVSENFDFDEKEELKIELSEDLEESKYYKEAVRKQEEAHKTKVLSEATETIINDPKTHTSEATQKLVDFDNALSDFSNQVSDTSEYEAFLNSAPSSVSKRMTRKGSKSSQAEEEEEQKVEEMIDQQLRAKEEERLKKIRDEYLAKRELKKKLREQLLEIETEMRQMREDHAFELEGI